MKKCLTFMALACVGLMTAGTASADTIDGTFVQATAANTVTVSDGTAPLTSGWTTGADQGAVLGTGFNHSLFPQEIVTTIATGLNPGDVYDIGAVYTNLTFFTLDNFAFGHSSGVLIDVPLNHADVEGGVLTDLVATGGNVGAYDLDIGLQTVASDGTLKLYADDSSTSESTGTFTAYKGATFEFVSAAAAVPEPSSLAVLGLVGGLGLLRRRR